MLRYFGVSSFITLAAIVIAGIEMGLGAVITITVLIAIEVAFSFDNAVINAKVLDRLSKFWQQLFLTVGMFIAIFGMRFVFPIVIVMVTAGLSWSQVINDALKHPDVYAAHLLEAHTSIAAFGGTFLLVLTLYFLFDDFRKELWWKQLEGPLQRVKSGIWLPPALAIAIVSIIAFFADHDRSTILQAGIIGAVTYTAIKLFIEGLSKLSGADNHKGMYTGWGAFGAFIYLEILDASFSFDGVLGAFAITDKVLLIALGLGVGAVWVRSLTIYMVRKGTLKAYVYLEHGAHYAIFILATALLSSIFLEIPDAIVGITGIGVIITSFIASRQALRAKQAGKL